MARDRSKSPGWQLGERESKKHIKRDPKSTSAVGSTLVKQWHKFEFFTNRAAILRGDFFNSHKRYILRTRGCQSAAMSVIALAYTAMVPMVDWDRNMVNEIMEVGDRLQLRSCVQLDFRDPVNLSVKQVQMAFYLGANKVTMKRETDVITGRMFEDFDDRLTLCEALDRFFDKYTSGILQFRGVHLALWLDPDGSYYYMDTFEKDDQGHYVKDGSGRACVVRCADRKTYCQLLRQDLTKVDNPNIKLVPISVLRIVPVDTRPPKSIVDVENVHHDEFRPYMTPVATPKEGSSRRDLSRENTIEGTTEKKAGSGSNEGDRSPKADDSQGSPSTPPKENELIIEEPLEPMGDNYYTPAEDGRSGILRAAANQLDPRFSRFEGRQGVANAVAAIAMLRIVKAKDWITRELNTILLAGESIYSNFVRTSGVSEATMNVNNFPKCIEVEDRLFRPRIKETTVVGRLGSTRPDVLNLSQALSEFFKEHDAAVVKGPHVVAVWQEERRYFMFDPNPRTDKGEALAVRPDGADHPKAGKACVLWFNDLEDLVQLFIKNMERQKRKEQFEVCSVRMEDCPDSADDWFDFAGVGASRWILRGTFSEASKRFRAANRGRQATPTAMVALALVKLLPMELWSTEIVDEATTEGDRIYTISVEELKRKELFARPELLVTEVLPKFRMRNKEANFEVEDCVINGLLEDQGLLKGLEEFFVENETGVLTARGHSVAVWRSEGLENDTFYTFDPHACDDQGYSMPGGAACVMRFFDLEDLVRLVEANLPPGVEEQFNLSRVDPELWDVEEEGTSRPPLYLYTEVDKDAAILSGTKHQGDVDYGLSAGKQGTANCMVALGMANIWPAAKWQKHIVDDILDIGDELYVDTVQRMEAEEAKKRQDPKADIESVDSAGETKSKTKSKSESGDGEPFSSHGYEDEDGGGEDGDVSSLRTIRSFVDFPVDTKTVATEFFVGLNKFTAQFDESEEAGFEDDSLRDVLERFFDTDEDATEIERMAILENKEFAAAVWCDQGLFYVFHPDIRGSHGEALGRPLRGLGQLLEGLMRGEDEGNEGDYNEEVRDLLAAGDNEATMISTEKESLETPPKNQPDEELDTTDTTDEEENLFGEGSRGEPEEPIKDSIGTEEERSERDTVPERSVDGYACSMWFTTIERLYQHLKETDWPDVVRLTPLKLDNRPDFHMNKTEEGQDCSGDWHKFKEVDCGKWVLRGTVTMTDEALPEENRDQQDKAVAMLAFTYLKIKPVEQFTSSTVDNIVRFGDRLMTASRRKAAAINMLDGMEKEKAEELALQLSPDDLQKTFYMDDRKFEVAITTEVYRGDIKADDDSEVMSVSAALKDLLSSSKSIGIFNCKNKSVAIWREGDAYYMMDGRPGNPTGARAPHGTACITRFSRPEDLAKLIVDNQELDGSNTFTVDKVTIASAGSKPKSESYLAASAAMSKRAVTAFVPLATGKSILRATFSQEHPKYGRGPNMQSAPNCMVALATAIMQKPETWTRLVLDEVLDVGDCLYTKTLDTLGVDFNPWEDHMSVVHTNKDYRMGVTRVNWCIEPAYQSGIIQTPSHQVKNLRGGIKAFFEENAMGILETETFSAAIWLDENKIIYMFLPNPCGPTGLPAIGGLACTMIFGSTNDMAEHIMASIQPELRDGPYLITPLDIILDKVLMKQYQRLIETPEVLDTTNIARTNKNAERAQKRRLRLEKTAELVRREEAHQLRKSRMGFLRMSDDLEIVRGSFALSSRLFSEHSRNLQGIPTCVVAMVMTRMHHPSDWTYKNLDCVLASGDQLYKDSFIYYRPASPFLGLKNVMRTFYIDDVKVTVVIYKPSIKARLVDHKLQSALADFFTQENAGMVYSNGLCFGIYTMQNRFYVFDPYDCDKMGDHLKIGGRPGTACLMRFSDLGIMTSKIFGNIVATVGPEPLEDTFKVNAVKLRRAVTV